MFSRDRCPPCIRGRGGAQRAFVTTIPQPQPYTKHNYPPHQGKNKINPPPLPTPKLPSENHRCFNCTYPLKNLRTFRCPECNHLTSPEELARNAHYLKNAHSFVVRCIAIPTGAFAGLSIIAAILAALSTNEEFLVIIPFALIIYLIIQPWAILFAAARLTQIHIIKQITPAALSQQPTQAILTCLFHIIWLTLIPTIINLILLTITFSIVF